MMQRIRSRLVPALKAKMRGIRRLKWPAQKFERFLMLVGATTIMTVCFGIYVATLERLGMLMLTGEWLPWDDTLVFPTGNAYMVSSERAYFVAGLFWLFFFVLNCLWAATRRKTNT